MPHSLQITDIGRDGFNLGSRQIVRRRRHDRRCINRRTLASHRFPNPSIDRRCTGTADPPAAEFHFGLCRPCRGRRNTRERWIREALPRRFACRWRWIPLAPRRMASDRRFLKCAARAASIDGLRTCATLNMIGFVRLRSVNARNWFSMYWGCCPASRGIGKYPR